MEIVGELKFNFQCWCLAVKVNAFDGLGELILEQFKNTLPGHFVNNLN